MSKAVSRNTISHLVHHTEDRTSLVRSPRLGFDTKHPETGPDSARTLVCGTEHHHFQVGSCPLIGLRVVCPHQSMPESHSTHALDTADASRALWNGSVVRRRRSILAFSFSTFPSILPPSFPPFPHIIPLGYLLNTTSLGVASTSLRISPTQLPNLPTYITRTPNSSRQHGSPRPRRRLD